MFDIEDDLQQDFAQRHIGSRAKQQQAMLEQLGFSDMTDFIEAVIPNAVRLKKPWSNHKAVSEAVALKQAKQMMAKNQSNKNYIGQGYYPTITPSVIIRNVLENPDWYTPYTPYQAEVSQGRLEALLNFQQLCIDLTGMPLAGASLLDEATAAAEAMAMCYRLNKNNGQRFWIDQRLFAQSKDVLFTRAYYQNWQLVTGDWQEATGPFFGAIIQYTGIEGDIVDLKRAIAHLKKQGATVAVAADLMQLILLESPGSAGADIVFGSSQRFGVPISFGGPHAAFFAFKEEDKRQAPGRIIGLSIDAAGSFAYRMALQTREQHIRREKATSNICTSQALLASLAGFYAVYHGPERLRRIAKRMHILAASLAEGLKRHPILQLAHSHFVDTLCVICPDETSREDLLIRAKQEHINLGILGENRLLVAFNECSDEEDLIALARIFSVDLPQNFPIKQTNEPYWRDDQILTHPIFNQYHSEQEMTRYLKRLVSKDISLTRSMIALGSCTMKLNAASEMLPITWSEVTEPHPFAPREQVQGYMQLINDLQHQLAEITGFAGVSLQPNSGAQGEFTGLLLIRRYQESIGQGKRNICLIPRSAHGTNPASAQMLGFKVVVVNCDKEGNVDLEDLKSKVEQYHDKLSTLMITYPSTHGVYEEQIMEICDIVHKGGGQVYMDGANMNAQLGLMRPAELGADVLHMNLHKTFCIPHGGGGPGVGPVGFKQHLAAFAPDHVVAPTQEATGQGAVSAAPYGSAGILIITWMYLRMMGTIGLKTATENALLNANYIAYALSSDYSILYRGKKGWIAHECIIDLRPLKTSSGITEVDFAKRLIDYGFHAPTMSFPVPGTLMIEPTESEDKEELDRFIQAMRQIKKEIVQVEQGKWPKQDNPLVNAPHTAFSLVEDWTHPYSREQAVYPIDYVKKNKYWPPVARVDEVQGDRQLICHCLAID